jgi:hypothetical protein
MTSGLLKTGAVLTLLLSSSPAPTRTIRRACCYNKEEKRRDIQGRCPPLLREGYAIRGCTRSPSQM